MVLDGLPADQIAVSLITGFLGSGKTTLIRHLLRNPAMRDAVVIVNEFGEVGLDHKMMEAEGQKILLLESGCICCSLEGSLVETLERMARQRTSGRIPPFGRVLVETTGIADPGPVMHELFSRRAIRLGVALDRVITLVDAASGWATLDRHEVSLRQAALANCILVSKADLGEPERNERLFARLAAINPGAVISEVSNGMVDPGALFDARDELTPNLSRATRNGASPATIHSSHNHDRITTAAVSFAHALSADALNAWLEQASLAYGSDLLRVKGILNIEGRSLPVVIHGVQGRFHPAAELVAWPDDDKTSRLVFVLYDISGDALIHSLKRALRPC